jgi:exodeoxyribonuclease VII large subunit
MSRQVKHDGRGAFEIRFPFDRRLVDLVKTLPNRRWKAEDRFWWAPEDDVLEVVELLHPEGFRFDDATRRLYSACGGSLSFDATPSAQARRRPGSLFDAGGGAVLPFDAAPTDAPGRGADDDYSVAALNQRVRDVLEQAFPRPLWLVGEIQGFNKSAHRKHVGFQLVERDPRGEVTAQVQATLFEGTRREVELELAKAGNPFRIEDELTVRLRVRIELHTGWGSYRVIVDELDVNYTLGEAARRREEILRRLTDEGLLECNTSLPFPALPLRVGLITSLGSDAYNDVLRTLEESGFAFRVTAHGARVQGRSTEPSVLNALDWFRARSDRFDAVLVCRGGGSRTDLAWFDSAALGRAVATFPLPVVVGIGHEKDVSVLDSIGWRCKTPTAAAARLVDTVREALDTLNRRMVEVLELSTETLRVQRQLGRERAARLVRAARARGDTARVALEHARGRLSRSTRSRIDIAREDLRRRSLAIPRAAGVAIGRRRAWLDAAARQLLQGARRDVVGARRRVRDLIAGLGPAVARQLSLQAERNDARERRLRLADPRRVLERGYAIVRGPEGRVLYDPAQAPAGTGLTAELRDGGLRLRSEGPREDEDSGTKKGTG